MVGYYTVSTLFHGLQVRLMSADVERAAHNAFLTLIGKWCAIAAVPLMLAIGGVLWGKIDKSAEMEARLEEKISSLIEHQIPGMQTSFNSRFDSQADRITAHDYRLNRLEDWRNSKGNQ